MIKDSDKIVWIILNAVKHTKIGKHKLAEFLKGSKAKDIAHLSSQQGYGGLLWYDIETIAGFIEQLEQMGVIARIKPAIDEYYSVLELTEAGKKVLDEKIKIELQIIKKEKPLIVGATEKTTFDLFKTGKTIEEISKERDLARSTIYDHLCRLVANNYLSSSEFVPENIIKQILEAKSKLPNTAKLKEIKEILPEEITYNEIRCVLADKTKKVHSKTEDEKKIIEESLK
ncbi:helix-turn-helix domain-containing protein [Candidatus Woesearchaeota archaeon]|nr:helix-turn-helix domain-containing protein [Candidatus Woesearchaeota archaeon]